MEIMFHHSNAELPLSLERWLNRFLVTPRMHGIHHSIVPEERNANWSSGLTAWDWLHGTLRLDVPQEAIVIGVPAYRDPQELTLPKLVVMPFQEQRSSDCLPNGTRPTRDLPSIPTEDTSPKASTALSP
jgi:sterol desaturase/sphingolipid hydroxylase (fatty acid hydroxylase superfamily)